MSEGEEFEKWLRNKIKFTLYTLAMAVIVYLGYRLFKHWFTRKAGERKKRLV